MTDDGVEHSHEVELSAEVALTEFGPIPKVGLKLRRTRQIRFDRVLDSAAHQAGLGREQLGQRLAVDGEDKLRDVLALAVGRAIQVEDDEYLDALGRLIAGALDSAAVDEIALVTAELIQLEPAHLRALLGFLHFGRDGNEKADPGLSPADADWASNRNRTTADIASLLRLGREATSQVLLRLDRGGFIKLNGGPVQDDESTHSPTDWSGRVVSLLFPGLRVTFLSTTSEARDEKATTTARRNAVAKPAPANPARELERETRAIAELEKEIKELERARFNPLASRMDVLVSGDGAWLNELRRRLRRVDPANPWASD